MDARTLSALTNDTVSPETIHRGSEELPFVRIVPEVELKVLHVNLQTGLWVTRARFDPGYKSLRHYHHGNVFAFTVGGCWRYLEYDGIYQAGSYLYEPAGSVHTLCTLADSPGPADVWFSVTGRNDDLDEAGNVVYSYGGEETLANYMAACEKAGLGRPSVIGV